MPKTDYGYRGSYEIYWDEDEGLFWCIMDDNSEVVEGTMYKTTSDHTGGWRNNYLSKVIPLEDGDEKIYAEMNRLKTRLEKGQPLNPKAQGPIGGRSSSSSGSAVASGSKMKLPAPRSIKTKTDYGYHGQFEVSQCEDEGYFWCIHDENGETVEGTTYRIKDDYTGDWRNKYLGKVIPFDLYDDSKIEAEMNRLKDLLERGLPLIPSRAPVTGKPSSSSSSSGSKISARGSSNPKPKEKPKVQYEFDDYPYLDNNNDPSETAPKRRFPGSGGNVLGGGGVPKSARGGRGDGIELEGGEYKWPGSGNVLGNKASAVEEVMIAKPIGNSRTATRKANARAVLSKKPLPANSLANPITIDISSNSESDSGLAVTQKSKSKSKSKAKVKASDGTREGYCDAEGCRDIKIIAKNNRCLTRGTVNWES